MKVDGSFIATLLETAAVVSIYFGWRGITEGACTVNVSYISISLTMRNSEDWDVDYYPS